MLTRSFSGFEGVPRRLKRPLRHRLAMAPSPRRRSRRSILPVEGNSNLPYSITPSPFPRSRLRKKAVANLELRENGDHAYPLDPRFQDRTLAGPDMRTFSRITLSPHRSRLRKKAETRLEWRNGRDHAYPLVFRLRRRPRRLKRPLRHRLAMAPSPRRRSRRSILPVEGNSNLPYSNTPSPFPRSRRRKTAEANLELRENGDHACRLPLCDLCALSG